MAKRLYIIANFAIILATTILLLHRTDARDYVVGDNLGWTVPSNGVSAYTTWASRYNFEVGDTLVFNFGTGFHDVATVTKESFDKCDTNSTLAISYDGPLNVTLNSTGDHYFICAFPNHCAGGQKLAITVTADTPGSAPNTPSPPPPNSSNMASSLSGHVLVVLVSIAAVAVSWPYFNVV